MPWKVEKTSQCSDSKPWGVINKNTGKVVPGGCHKTKADAVKHMQALYTNVEGIVASEGVQVSFVTLPDQPIMEAGVKYKLFTGEITPTEQMLRDAATAASEDPTLRTPRIKLGHVTGGWMASDGSTSGEPAFGRYANIRYVEESMSLVGDQIYVPDWLAAIMPSAYPNRSFEGYQGYESNAGKFYSLVITAVSLLGVEFPGISSLEDFVAAMINPEVIQVGDKFLIKASGRGRQTKGQIDAADVQTAFYKDFATEESGRYWWWLRAIRLDPDEVIAEDPDGELYRVPFAISDRSITFTDATPVYIEYVDDGSRDPVEATVLDEKGRTIAVFATAASSRPTERKVRSSMDPKKLREQLGLPEDATDAQVQEKMVEQNLLPKPASETPPQSPNPGEEPEPASTPEPEPEPTPEPSKPATEPTPAPASQQGELVPAQASVAVPREEWEAMKKALARTEAAGQQIATDRRREKVHAAIREGRIAGFQEAHFMAAMEADEDGTTKLLQRMMAGTVPVTERAIASVNADGAVADQSDYPLEWLSPAERRKVSAHRAGTLPEAGSLAASVQTMEG